MLTKGISFEQKNLFFVPSPKKEKKKEQENKRIHSVAEIPHISTSAVPGDLLSPHCGDIWLECLLNNKEGWLRGSINYMLTLHERNEPMSWKGWYSAGPKWWAPCLTLGNWNIVNNSAWFVAKISGAMLSHIVQRPFGDMDFQSTVSPWERWMERGIIVEAAAFAHLTGILRI